MTRRTKEISTIVCPASPEHCRQSEASILPFEDGRLFLAYTDFYAGNWKDHGPARIMGRWSEDEGETWSKPFLVQENIGKLNVMEASLLRLPSGRVLLSFLRKDDEGGEGRPGLLHAMLKYSDDECKTWSVPFDITKGDAYWCGTNDRFLRLSTGRILLPIGEGRTGGHVWISDDEGATWRRCKQGILPPQGIVYDEPTVVELADGRVAMFLRNNSGNIHIAHSEDGGETWKLHTNWGPACCTSPIMVRRVPDSSDLLMIWNNHAIRTNLTAAISRDNGESWENYRILEEQETWPLSRSHTYPSLAFSSRNAHITYWETHKYPQPERLFHLIYRRLPISWFYRKNKRRSAAYDAKRDELSPIAIYDGQQ